MAWGCTMFHWMSDQRPNWADGSFGCTKKDAGSFAEDVCCAWFDSKLKFMGWCGCQQLSHLGLDELARAYSKSGMYFALRGDITEALSYLFEADSRQI